MDRLTSLENENRLLREQLELLTAEHQKVCEQLRSLLNQRFGQRSEKRDPNQGQLPFMGETIEGLPPEKTPTPPSRAAKTSTKPPKRTLGFPPELPREEVLCDVEEGRRCCTMCSKAMVFFKEEVTEQASVIPTRIIIRKYKRLAYKCPDGHEVRTGDLPPGTLKRSRYTPSLISLVATNKFRDHLPLHRQEAIFRGYGLPLSRSSMWDMILRLHSACVPVVAQMRADLLTRGLIQADETPITVLTEGRKDQRRKGWMWLFRSKEIVLFVFRQSRSNDVPKEVLDGWSGTLQSDGYSGYDAVVRLQDIVRVGCWAHARRKFKDVEDTGGKDAGPILDAIGALFGIEKEIKHQAEQEGLSVQAYYDLRRRRRAEESVPMLQRTMGLCEELTRGEKPPLPKSKMALAIGYLESQWPTLTRFVEDGEVELTNNAAERALRQVAVGRKNWMFAGSDRGAEAAATLFSLMGTCKVLGIPEDRYLESLLEHPDPAAAAADLTPWKWAQNQGIEISLD